MAALAATSVAYFVVAVVSLKLAIPPGYATPLYPAAGIALAAALMYGNRMTIGISIAWSCRSQHRSALLRRLTEAGLWSG